MPPVIPELSDRVVATDRPTEATVGLIDVYRSAKRWPPGTTIAALRIFQVFPQSGPSNSTATREYPFPTRRR